MQLKIYKLQKLFREAINGDDFNQQSFQESHSKFVEKYGNVISYKSDEYEEYMYNKGCITSLLGYILSQDGQVDLSKLNTKQLIYILNLPNNVFNCYKARLYCSSQTILINKLGNKFIDLSLKLVMLGLMELYEVMESLLNVYTNGITENHEHMETLIYKYMSDKKVTIFLDLCSKATINFIKKNFLGKIKFDVSEEVNAVTNFVDNILYYIENGGQLSNLMWWDKYLDILNEITKRGYNPHVIIHVTNFANFIDFSKYCENSRITNDSLIYFSTIVKQDSLGSLFDILLFLKKDELDMKTINCIFDNIYNNLGTYIIDIELLEESRTNSKTIERIVNVNACLNMDIFKHLVAKMSTLLPKNRYGNTTIIYFPLREEQEESTIKWNKEFIERWCILQSLIPMTNIRKCIDEIIWSCDCDTDINTMVSIVCILASANVKCCKRFLYKLYHSDDIKMRFEYVYKNLIVHKHIVLDSHKYLSPELFGRLDMQSKHIVLNSVVLYGEKLIPFICKLGVPYGSSEILQKLISGQIEDEGEDTDMYRMFLLKYIDIFVYTYDLYKLIVDPIRLYSKQIIKNLWEPDGFCFKLLLIRKALENDEGICDEYCSIIEKLKECNSGDILTVLNNYLS